MFKTAQESAVPDQSIYDQSLIYHRMDPPGKLEVRATKPLANQRDLALAYSPGVAAACRLIAEDPNAAREVTARGNMVAVVTNGTAVLGLGNIGPLASKPVMEGKAALFGKFAGLYSIDIEVAEEDPQSFINAVAALEPSFGGINLEDIKAPECFEIEDALKERMNIPVMHDDQHGTAIIVAAAVTNWLKISGRKLEEVRLVTCGAGAAALACVALLSDMGLPEEHITLTDIDGVVYKGRDEDMHPRMARFASDTDARNLEQAIEGADIFLGLSAPNVLSGDCLMKMAPNPMVMALANPEPEIDPALVAELRPDAVMATGRTDYPNQVNNVLCFPFLFRGALDVGATEINEAMKVAAVHAIASLAEAEHSDVVATAYGGAQANFGPEYLIPKPFDPRLITAVAPAVAQAAIASGVATRPIIDFDGYARQLHNLVYRSGLVMETVFATARSTEGRTRIAYAEGEDERVLLAAQTVVDDGLARPIIIGRRSVVEARMERLALRMVEGDDFELVDPQSDPRYHQYWTRYHELLGRKGVTPDMARTRVRTKSSVIAALMVEIGDADAMISGAEGRYGRHLRHIEGIIGKAKGVSQLSAMTAMVLPRGVFFLTDTHVTPMPSAEQLTETTVMAAQVVSRFGIEPRVALLSHSNFGSSDSESALRMRAALARIRRTVPGLMVDGEMHGDAAIEQEFRDRVFPDSVLKGSANLLVMPSLDSANIAMELLKVLGDGLAIGPVLLGAAKPCHIMTPSVTVRGIVNMTALAVVDTATRERPKRPVQPVETEVIL
ncbi:MAG: NADP-dependent malic enzyme [Alphaproteobacteria bacterium]